jgi:hypothetical protein
MLAWLQQPPEQGSTDIAVAKATRDVVAIQDRPEESHIVAPRGVEARVATAVDHLGLRQLPQPRVGRRRIVDHRQGVQVSAVTGKRLFLIVN